MRLLRSVPGCATLAACGDARSRYTPADGDGIRHGFCGQVPNVPLPAWAAQGQRRRGRLSLVVQCRQRAWPEIIPAAYRKREENDQTEHDVSVSSRPLHRNTPEPPTRGQSVRPSNRFLTAVTFQVCDASAPTTWLYRCLHIATGSSSRPSPRSVRRHPERWHAGWLVGGRGVSGRIAGRMRPALLACLRLPVVRLPMQPHAVQSEAETDVCCCWRRGLLSVPR